jgi:translation initiation factor 3 subunit A
MDLSESQREDKPEGPTLQTMPSEQIRTYLINTFKVLSKSASIINPEANKVNKKIFGLCCTIKIVLFNF